MPVLPDHDLGRGVGDVLLVLARSLPREAKRQILPTVRTVDCRIPRKGPQSPFRPRMVSTVPCSLQVSSEPSLPSVWQHVDALGPLESLENTFVE